MISSQRRSSRIWPLDGCAARPATVRSRVGGSPASGRSDARGVRSITPRRACCQPCATTHVLLPAWRSRAARRAEVIGQALLAHARGLGHRRIAARLGGRPHGSRLAAPFARRAERQRHRQPLDAAIDAHTLAHVHPSGSPTIDAVDALGRMRAPSACAADVRIAVELAVTLTGLLYGRPRDPPGF